MNNRCVKKKALRNLLDPAMVFLLVDIVFIFTVTYPDAKDVLVAANNLYQVTAGCYIKLSLQIAAIYSPIKMNRICFCDE